MSLCDLLPVSHTLISLIISPTQTTSRRLADRKIEKFEKNIKKRGAVPETSTKKGNNLAVGPILLGFFIFVVVGSCKPFQNLSLNHLICWSILVLLIFYHYISN